MIPRQFSTFYAAAQIRCLSFVRGEWVENQFTIQRDPANASVFFQFFQP
jgi:hypothetical protein